LDSESSNLQIFSILGEENSLKINNFKINSNGEDNQNGYMGETSTLSNKMVINFTIENISYEILSLTMSLFSPTPFICTWKNKLNICLYIIEFFIV
jgi:hypothetical protein